MRIEVPQLPPASASPNSRAHWRTKAMFATQYQSDVHLMVLDTFGVGNVPIAEGKRRLDLTFIFRYPNRRDEDNLRARFKSGLDALVKARLLVDDDPMFLETGTITILVDKARAPMTIIELEDV